MGLLGLGVGLSYLEGIYNLTRGLGSTRVSCLARVAHHLQDPKVVKMEAALREGQGCQVACFSCAGGDGPCPATRCRPGAKGDQGTRP